MISAVRVWDSFRHAFLLLGNWYLTNSAPWFITFHTTMHLIANCYFCIYSHCSPQWLQHLWNSVRGGKPLYHHLLSIHGVVPYIYLPEQCSGVVLYTVLHTVHWNTARDVSHFTCLMWWSLRKNTKNQEEMTTLFVKSSFLPFFTFLLFT